MKKYELIVCGFAHERVIFILQISQNERAMICMSKVQYEVHVLSVTTLIQIMLFKNVGAGFLKNRGSSILDGIFRVPACANRFFLSSKILTLDTNLNNSACSKNVLLLQLLLLCLMRMSINTNPVKANQQSILSIK